MLTRIARTGVRHGIRSCPGRPARPRAGSVVHIEVVPGKTGGPSFARHSYAPLLRLAHDSE